MKNFIIIMVLFFATYIPLSYFVTPQLKKYIGPRFVICFTVMILAGFVLTNVAMYFLLLIALFVTTVRGRVDAACRYLLFAALIPALAMPLRIGDHFIGYTDSESVLALTAYIVARFDRSVSANRIRSGWTAEDYLVLTLFLIMTVGANGFNEFYNVLRAWIANFTVIVMPYLLIRLAIKNADEYRDALACFGLASLFLAVFAIYEAHAGWSIFSNMKAHLGIQAISQNMYVRGGLMRASATLEGPLALACFMTMGIFALACSRDFFKNSLIYYGSLAVGVVGLLASQSRGSLIALFISGIVLSMALRKWGTAAATAGTAVAFGLALPFLEKLSPALAASMNGGSAEGHGKYFDYRQLLLERGLQEAAHHPIIGMHIDKVLLALADITQGEHIVDLVNVYLVILLVSGVVGLFPFLALTIRSGIRATTGFGRFNDLPFLRARGFCLAAFTVVLIQFSFVSFVGRIPMNFMLVLCGIRLIVMERSKRSAAFAMRGVSPAPGSAGQTPQAGGGAIQPTGYSGPFETPELPIMPA